MSGFAKVRVAPSRLSDAVHEQLVDAIVAGEIPAESVLRDQELAEQLGVSRMPVREAIKRLEHEGVVEMAASRYTRVKAVTAEQAADAWSFVFVLAGYAARHGGTRMDAAGAARVRPHLAEMERAAGEGDVRGLGAAVVEAIEAFAIAGGDAVLQTAAASLRPALLRALLSGAAEPGPGLDIRSLLEEMRGALPSV